MKLKNFIFFTCFSKDFPKFATQKLINTVKPMKKRVLSVKLLSALLMVGGFLVTGCSNSDYDFDKIDATLGFGGDGLELPASSTADIPLKDVLDLEANGTVVEDATTHNYVFRRDGNEEKISHPKIHSYTIRKLIDPTEGSFTLSVPAGTPGVSVPVDVSENLCRFDYKGEMPAEVVELKHADIQGTITLNIAFPSSVVSSIETVVLSFPSFLEIADGGSSVTPKINGSSMIFSNVSTASPLKVKVALVGLDAKKRDVSLGKLSINGQTIDFYGDIHMALSTHVTASATAKSGNVVSKFKMNDITVNGATGRFNPTINDLNNLGNIEITGIPEFLQGDDIVLDLDNPQINLTISNDMDVEGLISGTLHGNFKDGRPSNSVQISDIEIGANGTTNICICRHKPANAATGVVYKEVENLSDIIRTIPDNITFDANVRANSNKESTFAFGKEYTIKTSYSVDAPLAFGRDAVIEYSDKFDGWNDDIKDLSLSENAYLSVTANAKNQIPVNLILEATPLGVDGNDLSSEIEVNIKKGTVAASSDGVSAATSPLELEIREKKQGGLKKLDGLSYKVLGKATNGDVSVVGVTLNAEKHTLKIDDIKIKLVGKVIGDFN